MSLEQALKNITEQLQKETVFKNYLIQKVDLLERKIDALLLAQNAVKQVNQPNNKKAILFIMHNMFTWSAIDLVYKELLKRDDASVFVLGIRPQNTNHAIQSSYTAKVTEFLRDAKIPFQTIDEKDVNQFMAFLNAIKPDWIIRQSPWDNDLPAMFSSLHLAQYPLAYIPYMGLDLIEHFERNNVNQEVNQNFHLYCDRIYCASDISFEQHQQEYLGNKAGLRSLGSPKLEYILDYFKNKPQKERGKTLNLLWTPHHSIEKGEWLQFATFPDNAFLFIKLAQILGEKIHIKLRPHPILFTKMKKVAPQFYENFIAEWTGLANTSIDTHWDQIPAFEWSDALITDGISFLAEYPLTNKPSIFMERKEHIKFNQNGELAAKCSHTAHNKQDIVDLIQQLLNQQLPLKTADIEALKQHLLIEGSAARIVDDLLA